ncbi:hypothetical protein [Paenibacillus sp. YYML68]|uniref:hypothetical protein n=1 Tax=Paenibacillus sp. YYML68 TaxID=2909250 RepID=UPI0024926919|nr:hypothetical protein [Paenibacillus sp. YYML68]
MSLELTYRNWSFDADLQIVHADALLVIDGEVVVDEPLCVDVGLPALLLSTLEEVAPNRWAGIEAWERVPFFCCGCGDPECRAFSFIVKPISQAKLELVEVEERQDQEPRPVAVYEVDKQAYTAQVRVIGATFLQFVEGLDYRPLYADTVKTVQRLLERMDEATLGAEEPSAD